MGQKVNPNSLRVGINKYWQSTWFEKKDYSNFLKEFRIALATFFVLVNPTIPHIFIFFYNF